MIASVRPWGLGLGRDGVEFRRIEDGDSAIDGIVHLRVTFGFRVLLAEGHGAEADGANFNAGAAELTIVHAALAQYWWCAQWATVLRYRP
jgi:hypothetical protein